MTRTPPDEYHAWLVALTPETIRAMFVDHGCTEVLIKRLTPQDNSKNQIYLGRDLTAVASIPSGDVIASSTNSTKAGSVGKAKFTAPVRWSWLAPRGESPAPGVKLIFYPQYPEVRLSGLAERSPDPPSSQYSYKRTECGGQATGRRLLIGVNSATGLVWGLILPPEAVAIRTIDEQASEDVQGVFHTWDLALGRVGSSTRDSVLAKLRAIHEMGWIPGQILRPSGPESHRSSNAAGTTLESLFGILPNSVAGPDFLGWELKAHGGNPLTLMTPVPTGGMITTVPRIEFMEAFGRPRAVKGAVERWDFTGRHIHAKANSTTMLTLLIEGWDPDENLAADGGVRLVTIDGREAMRWSFEKLLSMWKAKHAQTAYVQYERQDKDAGPEFRYQSPVLLCSRTSFAHLLRGLESGVVFYDPGCNIQWQGSRWKPHDRHQFRAAFKDVGRLYGQMERVSITT